MDEWHNGTNMSKLLDLAGRSASQHRYVQWGHLSKTVVAMVQALPSVRNRFELAVNWKMVS